MTTHGRKIAVIGLGYAGLPVAVALDVKSKLDRKQKPEGIDLWRL